MLEPQLVAKCQSEKNGLRACKVYLRFTRPLGIKFHLKLYSTLQSIESTHHDLIKSKLNVMTGQEHGKCKVFQTGDTVLGKVSLNNVKKLCTGTVHAKFQRK
jgi:hypothetical protein